MSNMTYAKIKHKKLIYIFNGKHEKQLPLKTG